MSAKRTVNGGQNAQKSRMTAVAQRDQVRCTVTDLDRSGYPMMHVQFRRIGRPALRTAIFVTHRGGARQAMGRPNCS